MDAKLFNKACVSASILKMGIPIQYHAIMEHIMKANIDNHNSLNAIDDLSYKFPMVETFKISKFDNDYLIFHDNFEKYYFYTRGKDVLYIVSREDDISEIVYKFLINKDNDIDIKKQIIHQLILSLFEIDINIIDYNQNTETYNIIYTNKLIKYYYKFRLLDKGYYVLIITNRIEEKYGISEICNKIS